MRLKEKDPEGGYSLAIKFQFHIGAIKRALTNALNERPLYFNSILVRLKEVPLQATPI